MPTYDYFCDTNARKVEVSHKMSETIATWGELCEKSASEPGETPADTPVRRLISGAAIIGSTGSGSEPPCASGGGCPGGMCRL
jgi:predicted nucleic acid-binding Zn ribbon protein